MLVWNLCCFGIYSCGWSYYDLFVSSQHWSTATHSWQVCPVCDLWPLQQIQNASRSLVFNLPKFSRITPLLHSFHRLPVATHIRFKTLMFTYKATIRPASSYMKALITHCSAPQSLWASSIGSNIQQGTRKACIKTLLNPGTQVVELTSSGCPNMSLTST